MESNSRREFLTSTLLLGALPLFSDESIAPKTAQYSPPMIAFPEKKPLLTLSDRPPLLESSRTVFTQAITPNDQFFVRWHMPKIPTYINTKKFRLQVKGLLDNPISLSIEDLKNKYTPQEITAVAQCAGNSRKYYAISKTAGGIQWGHGAVGCAVWKGVLLKDILEQAGINPQARYLTLSGLEKPSLDATPSYIREITIDDAFNGEILVAYSMNGEDLPLLNGFPLRLVIPGTFSQDWIKMLSEINVIGEHKNSFWTDTAYKIPDNECECISSATDPEYKQKNVVTMKIKSLIGYPKPDANIKANSSITITGISFDQGIGTKNVLISFDNGKIWKKTKLGIDNGRYAFRQWSYQWKPTVTGEYTIMIRAFNRIGNTQPFIQDIGWNPAGYQYNAIDSINVKIV